MSSVGKNQAEQAAAAEAEQNVTVAEHKQRRSRPKPPPDHLSRVQVKNDLSEENKLGARGCGLTRISEDLSEQLDIIPAQTRQGGTLADSERDHKPSNICFPR